MAVAAAEAGVPGEVLFLGDEHVVGVVDIIGGVVPAVGDALVLRAASGELARETADVGFGDGVPCNGGAPRQVEQGDVEHLLEKGALAGGVPGEALEQERCDGRCESAARPMSIPGFNARRSKPDQLGAIEEEVGRLGARSMATL